MKPRAFIGSSAEQLELAHAIQENLDHSAECTVWSQGVFQLSRSAMASLLDQLDDSDFGIFVLAPDDITTMRNAAKFTVRDNVVFELGMFIGRLGPDRCFLVAPRGQDDLHLPTDLVGITPADYDPKRQDGNVQAALGPACSRIGKQIKRLGRFAQIAQVAPAAAPIEAATPEIVEELISDPIDCEALIRSWMGKRPSARNMQAIRYSEVDRELHLEPGSARKYIAKAAQRYSYVPDLLGKETITFRRQDADF